MDRARTQERAQEAWRADSEAESARMRDVWALAEVARERLANPSLELMAEVLELLDVQITVLDDTSTLGPARGGANGGVGPATPRLRVEGSVPHAKLLDAVSGEDPSNAKLRPGEPRRR